MLHRPRIIPVISIQNRDMVKTVRFASPRYLGDPVNAVKIFNGKGVDELSVTDIRASRDGKGPDMELLRDIAGEAFMPLSYGGGITELEQIKHLFHIGYEKVILDTIFYANPELVRAAAAFAGSQSVAVALDVKTDLFGKRKCVCRGGTEKTGLDPATAARKAESLGAGELIVNAVNNDGMMGGYDLPLVREIAEAVSVPVIACGGAGGVEDIRRVLTEGGAHAAAAGSMFVYYGRNRAILINAPTEAEYIRAGIYGEE